jgi:hypothetical protein
MEDLAKIAVEVDSLRSKIQMMEKGTALIDSLNKVSTPGPVDRIVFSGL